MEDTKTKPLNFVIKASDIGQFIYCSKAWQLKKLGFQPESEALQRGTNAHKKLGTQMSQYDRIVQKSRILLIISIIIIGFGLIIIFGSMFL